VPSEATFSRYYNNLSETDGLELLMNNLLDQSIELNLLDTETMVIYASKLPIALTLTPAIMHIKPRQYT